MEFKTLKTHTDYAPCSVLANLHKKHILAIKTLVSFSDTEITAPSLLWKHKIFLKLFYQGVPLSEQNLLCLNQEDDPTLAVRVGCVHFRALMWFKVVCTWVKAKIYLIAHNQHRVDINIPLNFLFGALEKADPGRKMNRFYINLQDGQAKQRGKPHLIS